MGETGVAQEELHNLGSCAIRQTQLCKQSCAIRGVAQAELRNPGSCAIQVNAILVVQSDERVAQSKLRNPEKFQNLTLFTGHRDRWRRHALSLRQISANSLDAATPT